MALRTILTISLQITDEKDIELCQRVYAESKLTHGELYLLGVKQAEKKG